MRLPAQMVNWWKNLVYQWIAWLVGLTDKHESSFVANAILHRFSADDILSSSRNWHAGAVSDTGSNGLVSPRYWVVGDDGSGNTAIAYAQGTGISGANWANETGAAQAGSLTRCAALGTLCLGIEAGAAAWKLGGSANENGAIGGHAFVDVAVDPVNSLWVAITTLGIYTSPLTTVAWTQRLALANGRCLAWRDGRMVAVFNGGLYYSTNGTAWTAGYVDASATWSSPNAIAANSLGYWIVDAAVGQRVFFTPDGITVTEHEAHPSLTAERIFAWGDMICLPGIYMTRDPRRNEWSGVTFSAGVNERLAGSSHGAIAVNGSANAIIFGPTVDLSVVPFAT